MQSLEQQSIVDRLRSKVTELEGRVHEARQELDEAYKVRALSALRRRLYQR